MEKHPLSQVSVTMLAIITAFGCTLPQATAAEPAGDVKTLDNAPTVIIGQSQSDAKTDGTTVGAEPSEDKEPDEKSSDKLPLPSTGAESDGKETESDSGDAPKPDASIENGKLNTTDPNEQQAPGNKTDQPKDNGTAESDTKTGDVDKSDETGKPSDVGNPEDKPQQTVQPRITVANPTIARRASDGELTAERIIQLAGATAPEGYGIAIVAKQVETLNNAYWDYDPLEFDVTLQLTKDDAIVAGAPTAVVHFSISAPGTGKLHLDRNHVTVRADEGPVTVETLLERSGARIGIPDASIGIHPDQVDLVNQQIARNEAATVTVAAQAIGSASSTSNTLKSKSSR